MSFGLETLILFSKKTFNFHLSADVTAADAALRLESQKDLV